MSRLWLFVVIALLGAGVQPALAQVPTAEQLELLKTMSPEDRQALMEQLGLDGRCSSDGQSDDAVATPIATPTTDSAQTEDAESPARADCRRQDAQARRLGADRHRLQERQARARSRAREPDFRRSRFPRSPRPILEPEERVELQQRIDLVRSRNPYQLDSSGVLLLPGFEPIMLAGLNEEQATHRLSAIVRVPQARRQSHQIAGAQDGRRRTAALRLRPVQGQPRRRSRRSAMCPCLPTTSSVPAIRSSCSCSAARTAICVSPSGATDASAFPSSARSTWAGRTFESVANDIEARVARQMIGVRASVGMGDTRSIRVFVMGEANRPGSYTVSGLTTVTSALYASGGVKPIGSLRDIQLKRQGAVIRRLDLYDLLLRGDTSGDAKLLPGDVIFIPPVSATVAVDGEVQRPAIYELKGTTSVADIIQLAGGTDHRGRYRPRCAGARERSRARAWWSTCRSTRPSGRAELLRNGDSAARPSSAAHARRRRDGRRPRVPARARRPGTRACASLMSWVRSTNSSRTRI